jgi:hypothetical protein
LGKELDLKMVGIKPWLTLTVSEGGESIFQAILRKIFYFHSRF